MTNEQINNLEKRPYTFGNKKGIEVSYDAESNAVVIPEALFRHILSQIPSRPQGHWILAENQENVDNENDNYQYYCSECNHADIHAKNTEVPYCWYCGAKMSE